MPVNQFMSYASKGLKAGAVALMLGVGFVGVQADAVSDYIQLQTNYLTQNAAKDGVTVTPSGLQYEVIKSGPADGLKPLKTSKVELLYRGSLIDGTEFDNTFGTARKTFIHPTQVVPGWEEALLMMRPGDHWRLTMPANLGYGVAGFAGVIPPNSALVFEVEVIEVYNGAKGIPSREWMKIQAEKAKH